MNKDNFEGTVRSAVGQGEKILGQVTNDRSTTAQGYYDDAAGKARSAVGSAKDAVAGGVDAISSVDFSGLRDEISKLAQKVSDLTQIRWPQAEIRWWGRWARRRNPVPVCCKRAGQIRSARGRRESRSQKNSWGAVAIAGLIGLLIGKMS